MKEDIYIRVDCFYYYALSNSLYLIFYLLPYDSQITNQVFHPWIILKTRPSQISFRLSYPTIFTIIHFLIKIVDFFYCSDDRHPFNIGLKRHFFYKPVGICQLNQENLNNLLHTHGLTTPNASPIEIHVKCLNSTGRFYFFLPSPLYSAANHNEAWTVNFQKQLR